jgi:hypothetical protein
MAIDAKKVQKELDDIEKSMALLKRDFEIYFAGGSKLPPLDSFNKLEKVIKHYTTKTGLSYAERFRYNSLAARFNTYSDLWNKQMRIREEGKQTVAPVPHAKPRPSEKPPAEPLRPADKIQTLYDNYVKAKQDTGEAVSGVSLQSFAQLIKKQKQALIEKYQCNDVDFYVSVDGGKAKLKAKPLK